MTKSQWAYWKFIQTHSIWKGIVARSDPGRTGNSKYEIHYRGRGIFICSSWLGKKGFDTFLRDMGPRPSPNHSLDRIDNAKGYFPDNCRWATRKEQARNTRRNRLLTVNGKTATIAEWEEVSGISHATIRDRIEKGWSPEAAISTQPEYSTKKVWVQFNGESFTLTQLAEMSGVPKGALHQRLKRGWDLEDAMNLPASPSTKGAHGFNGADLARELGVTKTAIYYHLNLGKSKEEIISWFNRQKLKRYA